MSDDGVEVDGVVKDALKNNNFRVEIDAGNKKTIIQAYLSGKLRQNYIRVVAGDKVRVSLSPYDLEKGRIIRRL